MYFIVVLVSTSIALFFGSGVTFLYGNERIGFAFAAFGFALSIGVVAYEIALVIDRLDDKK